MHLNVSTEKKEHGLSKLHSTSDTHSNIHTVTHSNAHSDISTNKEIFEVECPQWQNWRISCTDYVDSTHGD